MFTMFVLCQGVNLNGASDERDTLVTVGGVPCNVTTLTATQLVCVPPHRQSDGMLLSEHTDLPLVQVTVGNLRFPLGHLQYDDVSTARVRRLYKQKATAN